MKKYNNTRTIPRRDLREAFVSILSENRGLINKGRNGTLDITDEKNEDKVGLHSGESTKNLFQCCADLRTKLSHHVNLPKFIGQILAPIYIFSGRSVPARLLCIAPWAKVIAVLRNPIDRAFSQYNFIHWGKRKRPSFADFIANDIRLLRKSKVLYDWKGDKEGEYAAWERYIKLAGGKGPVGRGLYAIQLEIWMEEFKKVNKSVADDLLVLQSEEMKDNTEDVYHHAVEFLGLERRKVRKHLVNKEHHKTKYTQQQMSDQTYKKLYNLFQPYNERLYKLLGEDEWNGTWDD